MARLARKYQRFKSILLKNPMMSPTDIAEKVYNCKSREVARVIATQCMKKLNINLVEIFERAGADDLDDVEFLLNLRNNANKVISCNVIAESGEGMKDANSMTKDFVDVPDLPTRLKAFELEQKLKGRLQSGASANIKIDQSINYVQIYRPERYEAEILETSSRTTD